MYEKKFTAAQYQAAKRDRAGSLSIDGTAGYSSRAEARSGMKDRVNLFKPWNSVKKPVMMIGVRIT
jgi:hypothetical protein